MKSSFLLIRLLCCLPAEKITGVCSYPPSLCLFGCLLFLFLFVLHEAVFVCLLVCMLLFVCLFVCCLFVSLFLCFSVCLLGVDSSRQQRSDVRTTKSVNVSGYKSSLDSEPAHSYWEPTAWFVVLQLNSSPAGFVIFSSLFSVFQPPKQLTSSMHGCSGSSP